MHALILTCNTGEGHNATAAAIREEFERRGERCAVADALGFLSPEVSALVGRFHTGMYRNAPGLFRAGYGSAQQRPAALDRDSLIGRYLAKGADNLRRAVLQNGYDVLVCVHVFSALLVSETVRRHGLDAVTCVVATDYTCTPGTESCDLDLFFVPHEGVLEEYLQHGIPRERLVVSGIPVRRAFTLRTDIRHAKRTLGVPLYMRNVLLAGGSMGCGPIATLSEQLADTLPADTRLTVLCGTNEKLLDSLVRADRPNVLPLGFTTDMPLWMDTADLLITKPGGLTITEAAAKRLPMLFVDTVGGCEAQNLALFARQGYAASATPEAAAETCFSLLWDPSPLQAMAGNLARDFAPDAAAILYDAVAEAFQSKQESAVAI